MLAWEQGHYFAKIRENVVLTTPFGPFTLTYSVQKNVFTKTVTPRGGGSTPIGGRMGRLSPKGTGTQRGR